VPDDQMVALSQSDFHQCPEGTASEGSMHSIYTALTFLTMSQALKALSGALKQPVDPDDLLRLCEDDQCALYVSIGGRYGLTALTGEPDQIREKVYCAGRQRVHSVEAVRRARPGSPVSIHIAGPVFLDDESFEDVVRAWECQVDVGTIELLFRSADILNLIESLTSQDRAVKPIGTRERESWSAVVAGLALAAGIDMKHADAAATTIIHAGAGRISMPSTNTVAKIIKQAAALLPDDS